ncbi:MULTISPECIES: alcohol dehydrogenase catalytic domain-containing protein [unclassified Arthrobacter]|uniref:alcohol dehydrogenase catalytic domain-containing protein n=1 Tax=unclassified Arthrobacter TaxID=235627 RepID=UPI001D13EBBD|nr:MULTISPECIES: alcohol dehydrogenase catalytic domain-containing protein [unclassified Arthrobacter]MCC3289714.1 alcohol dehydrogenase catalytic domain-containing protein [Arthrobacter sp. zg-Y1110]MCC3300770.1 alcohol dehydrogenase catalytic domain-containing protein [Arthrobacter sp. zg-Y895]UWX84866.1 alcohol dehydrogenase catalytic domain-containing protein [Arthrobacter sp. zg-Y1110]
MGTESTRSIRGAVLQTIGAPRPYAQSRPVVVQDLQLQPPGPGEIMVRIEAASLCHSDLSVVNGSRVRPLPMLLGHEAAGKVEELGEGVDDLAVGQRVVMAFLPRCGECAGCRTEGKMPCIPGSAANNAGTLLDGGMRLTAADGGEVRHHLGVSGFATHAVVNRKSVVPVDDDIPPHVAALLGCAVLTGGGAVLNPARPGKDDDVAIVGLGGVGMAALLTALSLDVHSVIGIDSLPEKLARARELGADEVYTPQEALDAGIRPVLVIEAAGHPRAFETAVRITAPGGTTVTVGLPAPDQTSEITPLTLTAEARTIIGSYLGSAVPARDIPVYAQLWREGKLPVEELVSSTIALEDINSAMDTLADGLAIRQVIRFEPDGASA